MLGGSGGGGAGAAGWNSRSTVDHGGSRSNIFNSCNTNSIEQVEVEVEYLGRSPTRWIRWRRWWTSVMLQSGMLEQLIQVVEAVVLDTGLINRWSWRFRNSYYKIQISKLGKL
jgi:hypothetical protein